jgi:hypothetical protein
VKISTVEKAAPTGPFFRRHIIALLSCGICLGIFWAWSVRPDPVPENNFAFAAHEYFPLQVEGWLQGRLDLPLPIPEGLLELANPYDPEANEAYRYAGELGVHDLSLYRDRLYMYWGPTPALFAFLPWRLLTGSGLSTAWAAWALTWVGWFFASMLILHVIRQFYPRTGPIICFSAFLVVGLGNFAAVVLQRPLVYEIAIAAAYTFTSLAWWQLAVALRRPPALRAVPLAIASLALGLAIAARASWGVVTPVLLIALWDVRYEWRRPQFKILVGSAVLPVTVCIFGLLLLNLARFDNPFEFGMRYQLMAQQQVVELFATRYIASNLAMYLLAPPTVVDYFPFLLPSTIERLMPGSSRAENVFGLLPLLPILWLSALSLVTLHTNGINKIVLVLAACFTSILGILAMYFFAIMRFELDFAPMLAALAAIGLLAAEERWQKEILRRWAFRTLWGVLLVATFAMTFLAACSHLPARSSPTLSRIEYLTNAIALHIGWSRDTFVERIELELMLPTTISPEREEVILATGRTSYNNVIYLRRPDADHVVVGFHHGGRQRKESAPVKLDETVPHFMLLEFGSLYPPREHPYWSNVDDAEIERLRSQIRVVLDGDVLLHGRAQQWNTTTATPTYGDLPGGSRGRHRFSGTILRVIQHEAPLK